MLGLVDDTIGITEAGYRAQMMNAFMNIKTAEKGLQFGIKKCKSMLIGKNLENVLDSYLSVDSWTVEHRDNIETGDTDLVETYSGQIEMGKCKEQKYLGFILSNSGDNMVNIRAIRNKSIGIIRKIFTKLNNLKLQKYYFECGVIFMNVMLRSSILYACETYFNLKETEVRQIERIEESFMRQLLNTTKGCPINQIYLELGQIPARFDIIKLRLLYLKYILNQEENSLILKVFILQIEKPTKFDWASTCRNNLKQLDINLSFEDIKKMTLNKYNNTVKDKCRKGAYKYLMKKRGSKGSEIEYPKIEMAKYLLPNKYLTIDEQRQLFAVRNRMVDIPSNFSTKENNLSKCVCQQKEDMQHIYICEYLNTKEPEESFEKLFSGNMKISNICI